MQNGKTALGLDNNVGALVCYLNICLPIGLIYSIIVLVTDKTNKLPRFHALNSILLGVAGAIVIIALEIVAFIIGMALNSLLISGLLGFIIIAVAIALFAAFIFSAVKAYQGQLFKLPVIGDLADKWSN
jgi:uncharacterized membrane protein